MSPAVALQAAFTDQRDRDLGRLAFWWNGCDSTRVSCVFWRNRYDALAEQLYEETK